MSSKNKKWFTLIELSIILIVLVLIYVVFIWPTIKRIENDSKKVEQMKQENVENKRTY